MNTNLEKAKEMLILGDYTCVLFNGTQKHYSNQKGVRPLIEFLESNIDFSDYCAADKVVGAGAAHLYVLLKVKSVWANVISSPAKEIFKSNNIAIFFESEVPHIINRTGDGICPIEECVTGITNSNAALEAIKQRLVELNSSN